MKRLKRIMALVIAMAMVLGMMSMTAFAEDETNPGSITINSPIMGASYKAYQVFDMTMNDPENPTGFAYSILATSPFYNAVKAYAEEVDTSAADPEAPINGLVLTPSADGTLFSVSAQDNFDAQKFGKYLEEKIADGTITGATAYTPKYEGEETTVTVATSGAIEFENLPLGYYLITSEYPDPYSFVSLEFGTAGQDGYQKWTFDKNSTAEDIANAAEAYAEKTYPDLASAQAYVEAHSDNFEKAWDDMTSEERNAVWDQLKETTAQSAINLINEKIAASQADDNTQPLTSRLVFVDSTTPHADVMEKNEIDKWDTPVNPEGHADMPDLPDHGEPNGGKNIVVTDDDVTPAVYADWSEANIGDDVHYQLNINATNFERVEEKDDDGNVVMENGHPKFTVKPIKEYVIADYENKNMVFNADKKLIVTIIKKQADGTEVEVSAPMDYTSWATAGYFFTNKNKEDLAANGEVFATGTGGIVIPWMEEINAEEAKTRKNVIKNEEFVLDDNNQKIPVWVKAKDGSPTDDDGNLLVNGEKVQAKDGEGNLLYQTTTHYFASKYDNDVTIRVDYYMTLKDTAVIDEPGNKNYAQFGVNYLDKEDVSYEPDTPDSPPEEPKQPEEKKEKDDATVKTYALAIHKVDENGQNLAGAKFKIKGLTVTAKSDGWYKVKKLNTTATDFTGADELTTDKDGNLVIEGLMTSQEVELMETEAPEGYNKLSENITISPQKVGETVTTTSVITYTDADGNVTTVSNTEVVYKNGDTVVGKKVITPSGVKYYDGSGVEVGSEQQFNALIPTFTGATETDVNVSQLTPYEYKVENHQGTELPSTGGIGTTIFYVVGTILVLGAGVVLITRRRMDA